MLTARKRTVRAAEAKNLAVLNRGAGAMPIAAQAPYGGIRYQLLTTPSATRSPSSSSLQPAPDGGFGVFRSGGGALAFEVGAAVAFGEGEGLVATFRPNLTPRECLERGIFGGCYFNPRGGKPGIFGDTVNIGHAEYPAGWFEDLGRNKVTLAPLRRSGAEPVRGQGGTGPGVMEERGVGACPGPPGLVPVILPLLCWTPQCRRRPADESLGRLRREKRALAQAALRKSLGETQERLRTRPGTNGECGLGW